MNKTRYSATEFGRNKPMNFRPSGTLRERPLLYDIRGRCLENVVKLMLLNASCS